MAHKPPTRHPSTPASRAAAAQVHAALSATTTDQADVPRRRFVWSFLASLSAVALSLHHPGVPTDVRAEDWKPTPREPEQDNDPFGTRADSKSRWRPDWKQDLYRSSHPAIRLAANGEPQGGSKQRFDIPAGDLERALIQFSRQTSIQSMYPSDLVAGRQTQGVEGDYTPEEALQGILAGTGLQFLFSTPGTVTLQQARTQGAIGSDEPSPIQADEKPIKVPEIVVKEKKERVLVVDSPDGYKADVSSEAVLRFPARIQELPQSVSVLTKDSIRERRAVTQNEALEGVAGFSKGASFGLAADETVIRGFSVVNSAPGYTRDNGLSAFNNYIADPTLYERMEVIKGAASFTSGLVTAGGFVNRLLKAPLNENFVVAEAGDGSYGHYRTTLDANGVMPNLPVASRFVFSQNQDPEFFKNSGNQRFSFLPSVRFSPREDFTVTITGNIQHLRGKGYNGTPTTTEGQIPAGIRDSLLGPDNQLKLDYQSAHIEAEKKFVQGFRLKAKGQYSHDKTSYRYANSYGYSYSTQSSGIGPDGNFGIYGYGRDFKRESWAGEVNLIKDFSLFGNMSSIAASMDYSMGRIFSTSKSVALGTGNIADPNVNVPFPPGFVTDPTTDFSFHQRYNQTGAYLQGLLRPFAGTTLMAALRGNWITQGNFDAAGAREGLNAGKLTPQIGLSQRLIEGLNVYASYGESINPNFGITADGSLLDPMTGQTAEIGTKWEPFGKQLLLTAALFRTLLDNVSTPDPTFPPNSGISIGGQSQRNQGFEFEARGRLLPELQVNLAYTYLDSEITKSTRPGFVGAEAFNAPHHTVSAFGSYDFSALLLKGLKLGAVVYYRSQVSASPFVSTRETFSGYTRADLFAIYAPLSWLSFQVNLNNIADAEYVQVPFSYGSFNQFGAPRHVIGMVRMTF